MVYFFGFFVGDFVFFFVGFWFCEMGFCEYVLFLLTWVLGVLRFLDCGSVRIYVGF